jgi:hypothetical protein
MITVAGIDAPRYVEPDPVTARGEVVLNLVELNLVSDHDQQTVALASGSFLLIGQTYSFGFAVSAWQLYWKNF